MTKILMKLLTTMIYIIALLWLVEFKIWVLFNVKITLMVIFGTLLLTTASYKRGMTLVELKIPASWNAMVTAYITTFILLFSRLSMSSDNQNLMYDIAMNCRPLLYGMIIHILLKNDSKEENKEKQQDCTAGINDLGQNDNLKLREAGLTEREIEIAVYVCKGYTNKEIGDRLFISESTVKKHTSNLYKKMNVNNREQLKHNLNY